MFLVVLPFIGLIELAKFCWIKYAAFCDSQIIEDENGNVINPYINNWMQY